MPDHTFPNAMNTGPRAYEPLRDDDATQVERTYAVFNHLVGLTSLLSGGVPAVGLIGSIIMWRIKCKESPYLDDHGREAVNFQLSLVAYVLMSIPVGIAFSIITLGIGAVLVAPAAVLGALALIALNLIGTIRGAIAANRGEYYRYPMCIRFIPDDPGPAAPPRA